jgi:hypothetical protein
LDIGHKRLPDPPESKIILINEAPLSQMMTARQDRIKGNTASF